MKKEELEERLGVLEKEVRYRTRMLFCKYASGVLIEREVFEIDKIVKLILEHLKLEPEMKPSEIVLKKKEE